MDKPSKTYTVSQTAEILGLSIRSVYRYVEACRAAFPTLTHGDSNRLLFLAADLEVLGKLVNLRKTTGVKLEALRERFTTAGQACQELAKPANDAVELANPGNRETGPSLQDLAAQVKKLNAEIEQLRAERAKDRAAMTTLLCRVARLDQPALPATPSSRPEARPWRPMALSAPPTPPKPRAVSWWHALLRPELQRAGS